MAKMAEVTIPPRATNADERKVIERFALFAIPPGGAPPLERGWINLHLLLWKYVIYELTVVETEDATFSTHDAWREAWRQFTRKTRIKGEIAQAFARLMDSRGKPPPDLSRYSKHIAPLGVFTESGQIRWNKELEEEIIKLGTTPPKPNPRRR